MTRTQKGEQTLRSWHLGEPRYSALVRGSSPLRDLSTDRCPASSLSVLVPFSPVGCQWVLTTRGGGPQGPGLKSFMIAVLSTPPVAAVGIGGDPLCPPPSGDDQVTPVSVQVRLPFSFSLCPSFSFIHSWQTTLISWGRIQYQREATSVQHHAVRPTRGIRT